MAKRTGELGRMYRAREGQWTWVAHRVTGVAIILFLFAHIVDTALIGWGPEAYNRVVDVYKNPFIRFLELGLVAAVIYHALNGVKIMLIDFFPKLVSHIRTLSLATAAVFVASMIPITFIMGRQIIHLITKS